MQLITTLKQQLNDLEESVGDIQSFFKHCYFDSDIGDHHEFLKTIMDYAETIKDNAEHIKDKYTVEQIKSELDD